MKNNKIVLLSGKYLFLTMCGYIEIFAICFALFQNVVLYVIPTIIGMIVWRKYVYTQTLGSITHHVEKVENLSEEEIKQVLHKAFEEAQKDFEKRKESKKEVPKHRGKPDSPSADKLAKIKSKEGKGKSPLD